MISNDTLARFGQGRSMMRISCLTSSHHELWTTTQLSVAARKPVRSVVIKLAIKKAVLGVQLCQKFTREAYIDILSNALPHRSLLSVTYQSN